VLVLQNAGLGAVDTETCGGQDAEEAGSEGRDGVRRTGHGDVVNDSSAGDLDIFG